MKKNPGREDHGLAKEIFDIVTRKTLLSWYLVRHFFKWVLFLSGLFLAIILLFDFSELLRRASSKPHVSLLSLVQMVFFKAPHLLEHISPFIFFFAALMSLWLLNKNQEITVMKASGLSIWQILSPLVLGAWIFGMIDLFAIHPLSSRFLAYYRSMDEAYFNQKNDRVMVSESGVWIREHINETQRILHIQQINPQKNWAKQMSIFEFDAQNRFLRRIEADSGFFQEKVLILKKTWEQSMDEMPSFSEQKQLDTTLSLNTLEKTGIPPDSLGFNQIPSFSKILDRSGLSSHKYWMYWHSLIARWFWLGIMVLLAAPCILRPARQVRQKNLMILGIGIVTAFLLYFLRDVTYALGKTGTLPILLAAWAPVAMSALLGMTALLYVEEG